MARPGPVLVRPRPGSGAGPRRVVVRPGPVLVRTDPAVVRPRPGGVVRAGPAGGAGPGAGRAHTAPPPGP
ncbi:hypothetical protein ACEZCY_09375, partial [Streptacidiphilus sp. N1-12]